jgi:GT2 family glycosyltransferase/nucleoside-diphosphate-sugar epimerase
MTGISVVVVTYRTGPALWLCLDSVLKQSDCSELIVVSNGNPKDVLARIEDLKSRDSRVRLIVQGKNTGFSKACNAGARVATGEYILLLNPDCILPANALKRGVDELSMRPQAALAGCRLVDVDGTEQRGSRRNLMTPLNAIADALGLSLLLKPDQRLNLHAEAMPDKVHIVPAVSGAYLFCRKRDYLSLGGLDESHFLHMEDMDFCYRIHAAGKNVICIPDIEVIHFRSSSDAPDRFVEWQKTKGFIRYFYRHFKGRYIPGALALFSLGIVARYLLKLILGVLRPFTHPESYRTRDMMRSIVVHGYAQKESLHESLAGKHFLVTGASSQIGLCLIGRLLGSNAHVLAFAHESESPMRHPNLIWRNFDLSQQSFANEEAVSQILIHTAPIWLLPAQIPRLAELGIKRIVAFSSTSVVGKQDSKDPYEIETVAKLKEAEEAIRERCETHQITYTILRPTMVYGVGLDANISRIGRTLARYGMFPIYGEAEGKRMPVHADDLGIAVLQCISHPKTYGKTYVCGGGSVVTYRQMVEKVAQALEVKPRFIRIPLFLAMLNLLGKLYGASHINAEMALRMSRDLVFDQDAAFIDFGYEPRVFHVLSDML